MPPCQRLLATHLTEKDKQRLARYLLWHEQPERFEMVLRILFGYDPIGICFDGNPDRETEYAAEANTIPPRLAEARSVGDVRRVAHEEFMEWFGGNAKGVERYNLIAADIWHLIRQSAPLGV
jgi:hypothetical protein